MSDDAKQPRSRWQDFLDKTLPVLAGGLVAGCFAITGSYFATDFQITAQAKTYKAEEQRKVFSKLMGHKVLWQQLGGLSAFAQGTMYYYEENWKSAGAPTTSLDVEEGKFWSHRHADLMMELAKTHQSIVENTAYVQAFFPDTPQLRELCERVQALRYMNVPRPPRDGSTDLITWRNDLDGKVARTRDQDGKPFDDLIAYLRPRLP